jgi:hypothetical protein
MEVRLKNGANADATPSDSAGLLRFALGEEPQPQ